MITYTNAACDEIIRRIEFDPLFHISTIHSFAWQLIAGFNTDIRNWLMDTLQQEVRDLEQADAKGRAGTKASITRLAEIEAKRERLSHLHEIKGFSYDPLGDNREKGSLSHAEAIAISAAFLSGKPLMQNILVNRYPFILIDESQDTNRRLIDALLAVKSVHNARFCLGFVGDSMQRIYADGKERIEQEIQESWEKPEKKLNHRCPKRIVRLINRIRADVDGHQQEEKTPEGGY